MKIKVSQPQSNWFVFTQAPFYKRGVRRSFIWIGLSEFDYNIIVRMMLQELFLLYLSLFTVIRETEYLNSWLQKISLEQLLFD